MENAIWDECWKAARLTLIASLKCSDGGINGIVSKELWHIGFVCGLRMVGKRGCKGIVMIYITLNKLDFRNKFGGFYQLLYLFIFQRKERKSPHLYFQDFNSWIL